ncbi:MAG: hypothetical protein E7028_11135 [Planctomycetaceae bacterium]|nr:hypothetical protein [Planctomycetaceae bacterium]
MRYSNSNGSCSWDARMDDFRRLGSAALELCYLACGRCELYFEIRLFPWDFAAASLIIREAGGYFEIARLEDADYSQPAAVFAAHSKEAFEALREVVYRHLPEDLYQRSAYAKLF